MKPITCLNSKIFGFTISFLKILSSLLLSYCTMLLLWTDDSVPFSFGKGGSGILSNCSLCGIETTLSFSTGAVCSSFYAEACAILQAFCWSLQHQHFCHFSSILLPSDSRPVFATSSSHPSFVLPQSLSQIWLELSSLSSCAIRLQWVLGHLFL